VDEAEYVRSLDREAAIRYIKGAAQRYTRSRSDVGTAAHKVFEKIMEGKPPRSVHPDVAAHKRHFEEFIAAVNPHHITAEQTAWSTTHNYAGRFDEYAVVWLDDEGIPTPDRSGIPRCCLIDWKTSKDAHAEVGLQLSAYANADYMVFADGARQIMPPVHAAFVLHITANGWSFIPVDIGPAVFAQFLHLRATFDYEREHSKHILGKPVARSQRNA
jgi:hypothetical protein